MISPSRTSNVSIASKPDLDDSYRYCGTQNPCNFTIAVSLLIRGSRYLHTYSNIIIWIYGPSVNYLYILLGIH